MTNDSFRWMFTPKSTFKLSPILERFFKDFQKLEKKRIQGITLALREDSEEDEKVVRLVLAFFEKISLEGVKASYPQTIKALFILAYQLVMGKWGESLAREALAVNERLLLPTFFIPFLKKAFPKNHLETFSSQENQAFSLFFRKSLENLSQPSHVLFEMMLEFGWIEEIENLVFKIKNQQERTQSVLQIIHHLLETSKVNQALLLLDKMHDSIEISKPLEILVEPILKTVPSGLKKILQVIHFLPTVQERDRALQKITLGLARHHHLEDAYNLLQHIEDEEKKQFSMSSLVQILASQGQIKSAEKLIEEMSNGPYKEDARGYVFKCTR